eukprot:CAMPEP_0184656804 /NCGR_PEP_ID=MMETSP0308-20130426/16766_1 /TAXON_ID=38269 /ORGANISM="Gloeochaete witrockiana, Strain SAG 46.84" /LENGTH=159 /DNA_ID=CAMNT_0027094087 /DNA_START=97 /DNA_END=577 /DNA_ORIENTATION=+
MAYIPCGAFFSTARSLVPNDSSSICDASRAPAKTFLGSQLRKQMEKSSESTVDRTIKMDYVGLRGKIYHHHWEHPMYNGNTGEVAWWRPDVQDQFPDLATTAEWRNSGNIFDQQNYPHNPGTTDGDIIMTPGLIRTGDVMKGMAHMEIGMAPTLQDEVR